MYIVCGKLSMYVVSYNMVTLQSLVEGISQCPCGIVTVRGDLYLAVHRWALHDYIFLLFKLQPALHT